MTRHENIRRMDQPQGTIPVEAWQLRSLLRIVAELRDPAHRQPEWFRDLAAQAGVDMEQAERLNPQVVA